LAAASNMLTPEWHGFNVLHTAASRVGGLDLGFLPGKGGKGLAAMLGGGVDVLWLLGADEFDTAKIGADTFVVYQGHHGDRGAARADVILPGAAYTEKNGTYVNTEGRVQRGQLAVFPPGEARPDWAIIRAFSAVAGKTLPYDSIEALRARLEQTNPVFARVDILPRFGCTDTTGPAGDPAAISAAPFVAAVPNYYQTDPISRASRTMAECAETFLAPARAAAAE
jgi:NADH-quinone oxidoreductase subunit G